MKKQIIHNIKSSNISSLDCIDILNNLLDNLDLIATFVCDDSVPNPSNIGVLLNAVIDSTNLQLLEHSTNTQGN